MAAGNIAKDLESVGITAVRSDCLCSIDLESALPETIIVHPHDRKECLEKIKAIVEGNPDSQFYIFALARPKRIATIGAHDNVEYIRYRDAKYYLDKILSGGSE